MRSFAKPHARPPLAAAPWRAAVPRVVSRCGDGEGVRTTERVRGSHTRVSPRSFDAHQTKTRPPLHRPLLPLRATPVTVSPPTTTTTPTIIAERDWPEAGVSAVAAARGDGSTVVTLTPSPDLPPGTTLHWSTDGWTTPDEAVWPAGTVPADGGAVRTPLTGRLDIVFPSPPPPLPRVCPRPRPGRLGPRAWRRRLHRAPDSTLCCLRAGACCRHRAWRQRVAVSTVCRCCGLRRRRGRRGRPRRRRPGCLAAPVRPQTAVLVWGRRLPPAQGCGGRAARGGGGGRAHGGQRRRRRRAHTGSCRPGLPAPGWGRGRRREARYSEHHARVWHQGGAQV